jgi:DNA replication and repair protein RecF
VKARKAIVHPETQSIAVTQLTLENFRNYANLRLDMDASAIVLTGANGAGKTNLLEAISMLSPGRGLRAASFDELIRHGSPNGWAVAAKILVAGSEIALGTAYDRRSKSAAGERDGLGRRAVIDGVVQKSSGALGRHVRILWLTPAMDRIFSGPRGDRRRLFDRLTVALDPDHSARLSAFEKLMRERNRLLAKGSTDPVWLSSLEHRMAEEGVAIVASRLAALDALATHMVKDSSLSFPWVSLALEGMLESELQNRPAVQVEDRYRKLLLDSRSPDRAAGRTLSGPHRSDLKVVHGPKGLDAGACSTGEQKAMLIGMILAHAKAMKNTLGGMLPVLLLDEVVAHLDAERRLGLFRELHGLGAQCWLTGTDRSLFDGMDGRTLFYAVKDGALTPIG